VVDVSYKGILPDLFREGQGVVAQGVLDGERHITAQQVLAKHDENYTPPEVKNALTPEKRGTAMMPELGTFCCVWRRASRCS
jgi:cytochrome c-type biogenesis protein CcmE